MNGHLDTASPREDNRPPGAGRVRRSDQERAGTRQRPSTPARRAQRGARSGSWTPAGLSSCPPWSPSCGPPAVSSPSSSGGTRALPRSTHATGLAEPAAGHRRMTSADPAGRHPPRIRPAGTPGIRRQPSPPRHDTRPIAQSDDHKEETQMIQPYPDSAQMPSTDLTSSPPPAQKR